jgi:hypothetical protein
LNERAPQQPRPARRPAEPAAGSSPARGADALLSLQRTAGNAALGRALAARRPVLQRWTNLGTESWKLKAMTPRVMTVWTGSKEEWSKQLSDMDDEDEFHENVWGFLTAATDPGIVGRRNPPSHLGTAEQIQYSNTIVRAPTNDEKLAFLQALYEKGGDLDLWHGGTWEGGPFLHYADPLLAKFIRENQGLYLQWVSDQGRAVGTSGLTAVAEQGGKQATMAMILNGGATALKGVDLVMAANRMAPGVARESAHARAMELIRNAGRTINVALNVNDARVAFEQAVVGAVFDHVWGLIPGGGQMANAGKAALKFALKEALKKASSESGPRAQAEAIRNELVETCNRLVFEGQLESKDSQDAINGFEAVVKDL